MPLTYSIAHGISFGIIAFTALNLITGKFQRVPPVLAVVAGLLITRYIYLAGF
jgi:AGZA family xanthine/uracil permease-like MFS transporter